MRWAFCTKRFAQTRDKLKFTDYAIYFTCIYRAFQKNVKDKFTAMTSCVKPDILSQPAHIDNSIKAPSISGKPTDVSG